MTDPRLYEQAAGCYLQAGFVAEAARCYRLAGGYRRAADLYASLEDYEEAAFDYERSGLPELGAWLLVHRADDVPAARRMLAKLTVVPAEGEPPEQPLRRRLVLARCELAAGALPHTILPVIDDVCAQLADPATHHDRFTEEWAVALAESVHRYDQVALVFAASVRGHRFGAAQRWNAWAARVLHTELTIDEPARHSA